MDTLPGAGDPRETCCLWGPEKEEFAPVGGGGRKGNVVEEMALSTIFFADGPQLVEGRHRAKQVDIEFGDQHVGRSGLRHCTLFLFSSDSFMQQ